jgi:hypothetical protein
MVRASVSWCARRVGARAGLVRQFAATLTRRHTNSQLPGTPTAELLVRQLAAASTRRHVNSTPHQLNATSTRRHTN